MEYSISPIAVEDREQMQSERFRHLRDLIGYDNARMAKMLNISVAELEDFCTGRKPVPDNLAGELELFVDWSSEVGDTGTKKELAKKYLAEHPKFFPTLHEIFKVITQ